MSGRFITAALSIISLTMIGMLAQAQQTVYQGPSQSTRQAILRLENRANLFRNSVQAWSQANASQTYGSGEDINVLVGDFNNNLRRLRDRFDRRQATSSDVQTVLSLASQIDDSVRRNPLDARSLNYWSSMRVDLNQLARAYNLSWQQSTGTSPSYGNPNYGNPPYGNPNYRDQYGSRILTGTYQIDTSRSEDARLAAERATRSLSPSERRRVLDSLNQRLDPPEQIAIDAQGRTVTLASTRAPQITFDADGRERIERTSSGRTIRARATLSSNQLIVSANGDSGNDFTVTFQPIDNQHLRVTRQVYVPGLSQPIVVRSTYQKTADVARFDIYNQQSYPNYPNSTGGFVVPDGARVVGMLDDTLSTRTAAVGDRFTLRVTDPPEFEGATIEGHVSQIQRSGRLTGRSVISLDFDNIRLRDGRTYRFAGLVEAVHTSYGETVRVDTEGAVRDESQTTKTEQRAAIGTAVGAIIGAIAGGGRGAAIGAILGAGGGAGSVYVEGRNELELGRGSEIIIRAGAPLNTPR
jgi:YmgG-like glycine-zipper protein